MLLNYVDSDRFGTRTFATFLEAQLGTEGVLNLFKLQGVPKTKAAAANKDYILNARADMRGRLVQAALAQKLAFGSSVLAGFMPAGATIDVDFDELDDEIE